MRERQRSEILERIWEDWEADLRRAIAINRVIIAEIEGKAVGFATYQLNETTRIGTVDDNAVLPEFRGGGIGGRLLAHVLALMEEAGMEYAQVSTGLEDSYKPARRMYARQGLEPLSRSVTYFKKLAQNAV